MLFQEEHPQEGYLSGQLLVAMPTMQDPRFIKSVIYVCIHNQDGAMGIQLNRLSSAITFRDLLGQLDIAAGSNLPSVAVHHGGPVEPGRGFVLHSLDYQQQTTVTIRQTVGLTATVDILKDIANGAGPQRRLLALGYAGWGPAQLDYEIQNNGWLTIEADSKLLFDTDVDHIWEKALAKLGVSSDMLSTDAGHA